MSHEAPRAFALLQAIAHTLEVHGHIDIGTPLHDRVRAAIAVSKADGDTKMSDEDFCLIHGRDHMRCDKGPIPYCEACDELDRLKTIEAAAIALVRECQGDMTPSLGTMARLESALYMNMKAKKGTTS